MQIQVSDSGSLTMGPTMEYADVRGGGGGRGQWDLLSAHSMSE